jgi:hypothetical protein
MGFPAAREPLKRLSWPKTTNDSGFPSPWRHPDDLFYIEELAISPVEEDHIYRLTKRWPP